MIQSTSSCIIGMKKITKKLSNDRHNKICRVAEILVGLSERGHKQNFNLGLVSNLCSRMFVALLNLHMCQI
jgi:hypothetical protein